jgi:hypothetical protein
VLCQLAQVSRYNDARSTIATITVQTARGYRALPLLAPTRALVYGHKHYNGDSRFLDWPMIDDEQYRLGYLALIEARMPQIIVWYRGLQEDNAVKLVLCCYCSLERPRVNGLPAFCHRVFVAQLCMWLNRKLAYDHCIELH